VRVFKGRDSTGVRGIGLAKDDEVISLAILRHFEASPAERAAYLKQSGAIRRAATGEDLEPEEPTVEAADAEDAAADVSLSPERYTEMGAAEQFVLTASNRGYGKRSSSFEFRVSGRGGKGIRATDPTKLNEIGPLVAAFPVEVSDEIMLVSNGGQLIRVPVDGIRIVSRASKGVRVFNTSDGERVVSVEHIEGGEATEAGDENGDGPEEPETGAPESGEGA
jgi:DNA gyrase subunit A